MKQIIILFSIMLFSIGLFAEDVPSIMNYRTGEIFTDFDLAATEAISGDTFPLGVLNDTGEFTQTDNDVSIKKWLNLKSATLKTETKFYDTEYYVWDVWEYDAAEKEIKLYWQWYFTDNEQHKPIDFKLNKYGVKK